MTGTTSDCDLDHNRHSGWHSSPDFLNLHGYRLGPPLCQAQLNLSFVFLSIDDRDRRYGHDVFHLGIPQQNVHGTAHPHQDRTNGLRSSDLLEQLVCRVG